MIREMSIQDYDGVLALWQASDGVGLSDADSEESMGRFLDRNPGLSLVALEGGEIVGAVLCGHDGRRGYVHHLAVSELHRRKGVGRALVKRCLSALRTVGIHKCHIFVFAENQDAIAFWQRVGWTERVELTMMSRYITDEP